MEPDTSVRTEAKEKMVLLHLAIEQLRARKKTERNKADDEDDQLLSRLLSQLDSMKVDNTSKLGETPAVFPSAVEVEPVKSVAESSSQNNESGTEELIKEIKQVKRQNTITHWLLTIMIVLTATWQFSEVSLLMKVKNKVTHPFRSVGNMIEGAKDAIEHFDANKSDVARKVHHGEPPPLPKVKIPELPLPDLPYMDLPVLGLHDGKK